MTFFYLFFAFIIVFIFRHVRKSFSKTIQSTPEYTEGSVQPETEDRSSSGRGQEEQATHATLLSPKEFLSLHADAYVCFDLETTGLSAQEDQIIEIGAVKVLHGEIVDSFSSLINPGFPIPAEATAVNHITDAMVSSAPGEEEIIPFFVLFTEGLPCAAHNVRFDCSFLFAACDRLGVIPSLVYSDSLQMARKYFPGLPNKKLGTVCEAIGYEIGEAHRSLSDAKAVHSIIQACLERSRVLSSCEGSYLSHMKLQTTIENAYRTAREAKEFNAAAGDKVLDLCRQDMSLAEDVKKYYEIHGWGMPHFASFKRAAMVYAVRGEFSKAIDACQSAIDHGFSEDGSPSGMAGRIEKLRQREKTAKDKAEKALAIQKRKAEREERQALGEEKRKMKSAGKPIVQLSSDCETVMGIYESVKAATRDTGINEKSIRDAANGRQKKAGGFVWKWVQGEKSA